MMTYGPAYEPPRFTGATHLQATLKKDHALAGDGGLLTVAKASRDRQGTYAQQTAIFLILFRSVHIYNICRGRESEADRERCFDTLTT